MEASIDIESTIEKSQVSKKEEPPLTLREIVIQPGS